MSRSAPTHDDATGHARAREAAPPPLEREAHIRSLMVVNKYHGVRTATELAEQWGLSTGTVVNDACRVSGDLKAEVAEVPAAKVRMVDTAFGILDAFDLAVQSGDWSAVRALVPSLEVVRKVVGVASPDAVTTLNVHIDARGQLKPETGGMLVAACETAAAMGLDPRAFRDALAGRLSASLPTAAVMALPAPACASPADRARELVAALCEVMPEVDDVSEVRPALLAMVADDE